MDVAVRCGMMVLHNSSIRKVRRIHIQVLQEVDTRRFMDFKHCSRNVIISVGLVSSFFDTIRISILRISHSLHTTRGWEFNGKFCFIYHLGFYIMQESFMVRWFFPSIDTV